MFRCYEKSIIEKEIFEMRRTKEWEETKQSILSAKELVGCLFIVFTHLAFTHYCVHTLLWSHSCLQKKTCKA